MRKKVPVRYQVEACECGAVALSMILAYFGKYRPIEEVRYQCSVSRDGCDAADLVSAAESYGLVAKGFRKTAEDLRSIPCPAILHWDFVHFVVLEGIAGSKVYISDPACGRRKLSFEELKESYTGIVLTFAPGENFKRDKKPHSVSELVRERLFLDRPASLYLILAGLLLIFPGLMIPILTQTFVDTVVLQGDGGAAFVILAAILIVYLYRILFTALRSAVLSKLQKKLSEVTSYRLMHRMLRLKGSFYMQRPAGELSNRTDSNSAVNSFLAGNFSRAVINLAESLFYLGLMLSYSRVLTAIGMAGVAVNVVFSLLIAEPLAGMNLRYMIDQGKLSAALCAGLSVASTMKAHGAEDETALRMIGSYARMTDSDQRLGRARQILGAFPGAISELVRICVIIAGGYFIINGECTTGTLTAFCMMLGTFSASVNDLLALLQSIQGMKANLQRIEDVRRSEEDARFALPEDPEEDRRLSGDVRVENVEFGYDLSDPPIVSGISFHAGPGSRVAIVGTSGCGKSTLGKLVAGLLEPWSGQITLDRPLSELPHGVLTKNLCMVNQNSVILSGTVRDNVTMWNRDYEEHEIFRALQDADALGLIARLPGGLDCRLEEGGANISGGERQKLEIARALLKKPAVLLLDEATSALDAVSEQKVMENIRSRGCTTILIAHRLSTVRDCDLILVLDHGRLAEAGTHEALLASGGIYKTLAEC